jgi:hypothetical protein
MSARFVAAGVAAALVCAGCGTTGSSSVGNFSGAKKAVAQTIEDLQSAGKNSNESKICNKLLAPALVRRITQAGSTCKKAIGDALDEADSFDLTVKAVTLVGPNKAIALVRSTGAGKQNRTDTLALIKVGPDWKIAALGG